MSWLNKAEGFLDTNAAIAYCGDDEEFYFELLQDYVNENKINDINALFKAKDWKEYKVFVHALKSTSLMIGATDLSEKAKQLEFACKEDRIDYVLANHEDCMKDYSDMLERIQQITCN